jgi:predicted choloylglycine hydrolase
MKTRTAFFKTFEGTSYEIGQQLGHLALSDKNTMSQLVLPPNSYPKDKLKEITTLLDKYCSSLNEEIQGFADAVNASPDQIIFYAMTYLERGCSIMAALPGRTENGHTLMARSYEFNDEVEDMCFTKTKVNGKYSHMSSRICIFGRSDGMNEHGLAACMACNAPPVGNLPGMQKPAITGLQFWVVIRSILENCRNVQEAIDYTLNVPIAYNLNLILADNSNNIALFQCIDGNKAFRKLDTGSKEAFLCSTNHTILSELKQYSKMEMKNSVVRNELIEKTFNQKGKISHNDLKQLLSTSYPDGLCCHYYEEFFGTVYSMIFDVSDGTIEMTFGSPQHNKWHKFGMEDKLDAAEIVNIPSEKAPADFW